VAAWDPADLALTHFGLVEDVEPQLDAVRAWLERWAPRAREEDEARFVDELVGEIGSHADAETLAAYEQAAPPEQMFLGLERYWRKRAG
jgi:hypothetical protein